MRNPTVPRDETLVYAGMPEIPGRQNAADIVMQRLRRRGLVVMRGGQWVLTERGQADLRKGATPAEPSQDLRRALGLAVADDTTAARPPTTPAW
jgi:hypothetical protein